MSTWHLYVVTGDPVQWVLKFDQELITEGTTRRNAQSTEPVAVWQAVVEGLKAACAEESLVPIPIHSHCNLELVIKQLNGDWKIKEPRIHMLSYEADEYFDLLGEAAFTWHRQAELLVLMNG